MKDSVFLATSSLEDFWDKSGPIVFLSDACTRYSRKDVWQNLSQGILRNPVLERPQLYNSYVYVQSFNERILPRIGEVLNKIHGKKHSTRYWRIIIGYWLFNYIHVLYERYYSIKNALDKYPHLTTIQLDPKDFIVPRDTLDFVLLSFKDSFNLQIYSKVLSFFGKNFPSQRYPNELPQRSAGTKNIFKTISIKMGRKLMKFFPVILRQPFIPRHENKFSLFLACGGNLWLDFEPDQLATTFPMDSAMRENLGSLNVEDDEFEKFFMASLPADIPFIFMEGYADFIQRSLRTYTFKPKAIWSATSWCWEEAFKFWAAERSEEGGTVLAGMQHGGNYGMDFFHPLEEHETRINDKFYSWGWEAPASCTIQPMPGTKYIGLQPLKADNSKKGILCATFAFPRYAYRFNNVNNADYLSYIRYQQYFISALSPRLKSLTRVRLFNDDYGWDCRERWQDFDPQVNLEDWHTTFSESMQNCRLHVSDHLSSTFVDALTLGKPTILFWDPEIFKVRPRAKTYMDDLQQAGIYYDTPQAAAAAVEEVYDDIEAWWNNPLGRKRSSDSVINMGGHLLAQSTIGSKRFDPWQSGRMPTK